MKKSSEIWLGELLPHFPRPPASVLCIGREAATCCHELSERGYEVTLATFPKRGSWPMPGPVYNVIIVCRALKLFQPVEGFWADARGFLAENGALVILDEFCVDKNCRNRTGFYAKKDVITGFYENGFGIKVCRKWPELSENGPASPTPCVKVGDHTPGSSYSSRSLPISHRRSVEAVGVQSHMILGRKDDVFLRSYRKGDEETILPTFKKVFNVERSMAHWYWKFRDNPFGAYKIAQAVSKDGVLAGHYSGYPVPFYAASGKGEPFMSFQIGDIMTLPGFRRVGLGKTSVLGRITDYFHHKFCVDYIPFLYGFVAGNHRKFGERFLGYRYMSEIPCHILDVNHPVFKFVPWIKRLIRGIRVAEVHDVGPAFDILFQKAAGDYGLLVKRDAEYLRWRYLDCPDKDYRIFTLKRFGKPVGWCVFRLRGSILIWGDALFQKPQAGLARILLAHALKAFPAVKRIEGWFSGKPAWWTNSLEKMGFKAVKEPNGLVGGVTIFDPSVSLISIEERLYYTMGDSDLF